MTRGPIVIDIKSFNQILGSMVRKIVAETPLSDVNPGSVFLSLLEACASGDYENNVAILNVLELLNVDSTRNTDLDNKAGDLGLTRFAAVASSGSVSFYNTNITKQSTNLYSLKPAPISGQTVLFVNDTTDWATSGTVYIGRGTNSFEGPIAYTSITNFTTYSQINLSAALQKDHLSSDTVINAQGQPDRLIPAGQVVKIPANNQNPEVLYASIRDAVIPSGEDHVDDVLVLAVVPGTQGNALINTIRQFDSVPFTGATVSNTSSFSTGTNIETDLQLRNRIKSYAASLARGTSPAILNAVINLSDPDENKRVASAALTQPVSVGAPSILYVDDGTGFQPSYSGQAVDVLLANANGTEEFLQLSNYPLPRPQVVSNGDSPFPLVDQMFLRVAIDGTEETITFETSDFVNISVASISEVITAINDRSTLFKARLTNDSASILVYPVDPDAEFIQVVPLRSTDTTTLYANSVLNFPTTENSYIALFKNSTRLHQRARVATVETIAFAAWNLLIEGDLVLSVDGTPAQDGSFTLADFPGVTSFALLSLDNWVDAVNAKFAGITAVATPSQTMQISSNKDGNSASVEILGGTYEAQMFSTNESLATGQESEFEINRQTGNIRILLTIEAGDVISAGVDDAKGFVVSAETTAGTFDFTDDGVGRQAQMVVVVDSTVCDRITVSSQLGDSLAISDEGSSRMRIMGSSVEIFKHTQPGHFLFIVDRGTGWVSTSNSGVFKIVTRGPHLTAGTDSYVEVLNNNIAAETVTVVDTEDLVAFDTDAYPQLWTSSLLTTPAAATLTELETSLNDGIQGAKASIFRTNSIKLTSTTEDSGSLAIPVSIGRASAIFMATESTQLNNSPLVANKVSDKDMIGFIKFPVITSNNAYLERAQYPLLSSALTANATQDPSPYSGSYSETVQAATLTSTNVDLSEVVLFDRGNNEHLLRSIAAKPASTSIGTQQGTPRTLGNHVIGDSVTLFQSLKFSEDDNFVVVMDEEASINTIDINAARTGQVNSGSQAGSFVPTTTQFSANDSDNEAGVDFGTVNVWGTTLNGTDFSDYAVLMRSRNWYASGGTGSSNGKFIVRAVEYGSNGDKMRFSIQYPSVPNLDGTTVLTDTPSYNTLNYYFGSDADRATAIPGSTNMVVTGPYSTVSENFPAGASTSGDYWDLTFAAGTFTAVQTDDVLSILSGSGVGSAFLGQFGVKDVSGNTVRVYNLDGAAATHTITNPSFVHIFPLTSTTVADIIEVVNDSTVLVAAPIGDDSLDIMVSTLEDQYAYVSDATALAFNHDPSDPDLQGFVSLYDGKNLVKDFINTNPNFTLKTPLALVGSGVSSSIYAMDTALNEDETEGEYFKLVPTTIKNVYHHLTQKALSQLPIVSNISIAADGKSVQVVSKQLGSAGAIEVLGGQANAAQTTIIGETEVVTDTSGSYLLANITALPNTYAIGDIVKLENAIGVQRQTAFQVDDTVSTAAIAGENAEYYWNAKTINFTNATTITITDVSSLYDDYEGNPLSSGIVFRWTHSTAGGETLATVKAGDHVMAYGSLSGWDQANKAKLAEDGGVSGLPIITVNDVSSYFDVVCPYGKVMSTTAIGSGTVQICPAPRTRWNLFHASPVVVDTTIRASNVVTIDCVKAHNLNTGDSVIVTDSIVVADGTYGPVTVTSPTLFTFANAGSNITQAEVGTTIIKSTLTRTKYRLQKMGINGLVKLEKSAGQSPRFADCGVAVDDYVVISGTTFNSLNSGIFRVVTVDNNTLSLINHNAVENLNTLVPFNNTVLTVDWTANSKTVTGVAGAFKNLSDGLWVKKLEDEDAAYLQVTGCDTSDYTTATEIFLGGVYGGISGSSYGVSYDQVSDFEAGVFLQDMDDVAVYEGDSAVVGDTLYVQNVTSTTWFSPNNAGSFAVDVIGNNPSDYRPLIRVSNPLATTEADMTIDLTSGFYVIESDLYKFASYRLIANSVKDDGDALHRSLYLLPDSRSYKFTEANTSFISHTGKFGYNLDLSPGTDGYLFYTGLLRRVQRTVDGFSPDATTFPERRAVGSRIETLPPLVKNISIGLTIATAGIAIQDIANNIKSAVIDYVNKLGSGEDVILSAISAKVMQVKGVAAVTFNSPDPSEERIIVATNEKAIITADDIGIN